VVVSLVELPQRALPSTLNRARTSPKRTFDARGNVRARQAHVLNHMCTLHTDCLQCKVARSYAMSRGLSLSPASTLGLHLERGTTGVSTGREVSVVVVLSGAKTP